MDKKLFIFDMDGTLINLENEILPETLAALKLLKRRGHKIVVATGRPLSLVKDVVGWHLFDYLICANGAYYYDKKANQTYFDKFVPKRVFEKMVEVAKSKRLALFVSGLSNTICAVPKNIASLTVGVPSLWEKVQIVTFKELFKYVNKNKLTQSTLLATPKVIEILRKDFMTHNYEAEIRVADGKYLDASPKGVSKYSAIQKILPDVDISIENVVAFGDSSNDIEMLKGVGYGIVMANGTPAAKAVADEIIGNNLEPSIANKLKQLIGVK